jgi:hypothetical protein
MKKIALALVGLIGGTTLFAQIDSTTANPKKTDAKQLLQEITSHPRDHFMIQYGYDNWTGKTDSVKTKGLSRHFNAYIMLDKPFKTNPKYSVGFGLGVGSSSVLLDNTTVDIAGKTNTNRLVFRDVSTAARYDKYKLTTVWAEIPIELRYVMKPLTPGKSLKVAIGGKIGTMINAHTKGKHLLDASGNTVAGQDKTIDKVTNRKFFNSTRLAGTVRIGYGIISLYGAYQVNSMVKDGLGPQLRPYSIGLTISGL